MNELEAGNFDLKSKVEHTRALTIAIVSATVALTGTTVSSFMQNAANVALEREKLRSNLILRAVEAETSESSLKRLKFFASAGFFSNEQAELFKNMAAGDAPTLGTVGSAPSPHVLNELGKAVILYLGANNDTFPNAIDTSDPAFTPYLGLRPDPPYQLNPALRGKSAASLKSPSTTVALYPSDQAVISDGSFVHVVFADGHSKIMTYAELLSQLQKER